MRFIEIQQVLGARHNRHRKTLTALGLTGAGLRPRCLRLEELNAGNGDALFFLRRQSLSQI